MSAPMQEVVDRSGWASNNALAVLSRSNTTTRTFRTSSKNNGYPPKFGCVYTEAAGTGNALLLAGD